MSARTTIPARLVLAGLVLMATTAIMALPALAAGPSFTATGTGTWSLRPYGDAVVSGPGELSINRSRPRAVPTAAVISPFDRTLPAPGECEGAHGWITLDGDRSTSAWLIGIGEVCGLHVQAPTSVVTYAFTGDFEVYEGHMPLLGATGFMEIRLAVDGTASTFATT